MITRVPGQVDRTDRIWSRVSARTLADQRIIKSTTVVVAFDSIAFDDLSEFKTTTHTFNERNSGLYWVTGSVKIRDRL